MVGMLLHVSNVLLQYYDSETQEHCLRNQQKAGFMT